MDNLLVTDQSLLTQSYIIPDILSMALWLKDYQKRYDRFTNILSPLSVTNQWRKVYQYWDKSTTIYIVGYTQFSHTNLNNDIHNKSSIK